MPTYEQIEGVFHDGLGTYNELCVLDALNARFGMGRIALPLGPTRSKMQRALEYLEGDPRQALLAAEIVRIEQAAGRVAEFVETFARPRRVVGVAHTPSGYRQGFAADVTAMTVRW
ncbi:MAG: hypothetical protein HY691_06005 [Chloroflexi bacterium]|nr:hypothetical protein [Chloroflexota bacterium]